MTNDNKPAVAVLPTRWRIFSIVAGMLMMLGGLILFGNPPDRNIIEVSNTNAPTAISANKATSTSADPSNVVLALIIGGAGIALYGINGKAITRFSSKFVDVGTDGPSDSGASRIETQNQEGTSVTAPAPAANPPAGQPAAAVPQVPAGFVNAIEVIRFSLSRASWNGLKTLHACQLAHRKQGPFNLRDLCSKDDAMSYDYAYGYLVATSSFGMFLHTADASGTHITITEFADVVRTELASAIEGRLHQDAADTVNKRNQLAAIQTFLR